MEKKKRWSIKKYLKEYKVAITFYILLYCLACLCGVFISILLANVIEKISIGNFSSAFMLLAIVAGIYLSRSFLWWATSCLYYKYCVAIMARMNQDLAEQAFKLNSKTFSSYDTGTFVNRIVFDPGIIVDQMADLVERIADTTTAFIMFIYILTLNVWLGIIIFVGVFACIVLEIYRVKVRRKNKRILRAANDSITSLTTEIVRSEKDIKCMGLEKKLSEVSKARYGDYKNKRYKLEFTDMNFWTTRNFLIELLTLGVFFLGLFFMDKGLLTLASFMLIYSNSGNINSVVWGVGEIGNKFAEVNVSLKRISSLFDEKFFVTEKFGNVELENVTGRIEFKNVSYTFTEFEEIDFTKKRKKGEKLQDFTPKVISENKIFDNLSFEIKPNTTVAFVGKSGSGKSTILNLMSKMIEADSGEVLIDGENIKNLSKNSLRKAISLVNQFPYIFDMTIRENLLLAKEDATEEEILEAVRKASLEEFIKTLPKGLDTKVGESGIKLSGGQRQRLAIARALLRNSNIIIFDESTSSLDNFAQEDVKKSIDSLKGHSTIVIVAHRLSTIKDVDLIYFLDEGKIIDQGSFEKLFEQNEKFRAMFLAENI